MTDHTPLLIDRGDTTIVVAGDWHGDRLWATKQLKQFGEAGHRTVLHVGDFGFFKGAYYDAYLDDVEAVCAKYDITIPITDGNHDDHIWRLQLEADGKGEPMQIRPHIWVLPRGYRWTHAGRTFVSLGGAPSINFNTARKGFDWFEEEVITHAEVAKVSRAGHADVMLTHDAPSPATRRVEHIRATNPAGWSQERLSYAATGAYMVTQAYESVRPKLLLHGHFHTFDSVAFPDGRRIQSLGMNGQAGNAVLLNLDDLSVKQWYWRAPEPTKRVLSWEEQYRAATP